MGIPALRGHDGGVDPDRVESLLPRLQSEDAFERLEASRELMEAAHGTFGFLWDGPEQGREEALARIRSAVASTRKRTQARRAVDVPGAVQAEQIAQLTGIPAEVLQKHLQTLFAKAQAATGLSLTRPRCQDCGKRPATVEVVGLTGGRASEVVVLCDPCAARRGEFHA